MAFRKTSKASVVCPRIDPSSWVGRSANPNKKTASEVLSSFDSSKWLLSHVSIMASVDVDDVYPDQPKKNWKIKPSHSLFVNNNGDAWERKLMARTYGTFLGANNYVEHNQALKLAKGKVVDVALREVPIGLAPDGTPVTTLYVDILIATSWEHKDLCEKILSREFNAVSMGCSCKYTICSRCGNIAHDETELCDHVRAFRKQMFYDEDGSQRIIAELCGSSDDPSSVTFVDASWVRNPAFPGAVLRSIINPPEMPAGLLAPSEGFFTPIVSGVPQPGLAANQHYYGMSSGGASSALYTPDQDALLGSLANRAVLSTPHHEVMLKAASEDPAYSSIAAISKTVTAADPDPAAPSTDEDSRFSLGGDAAPASDKGSAAADDSLDLGAPAADAPAGGDTPAADVPAGGPQPPSQEAIDTPLNDITDKVRDSILNKIKQELIDGANGMSGADDWKASDYNSADDSATLMKYASLATSGTNLGATMHRRSISLSDTSTRVAGTLLLMGILPVSKLALFKRTPRDVIAALSCINDHLEDKTLKLSSTAVSYLESAVSSRSFPKTAGDSSDRKRALVLDYIIRSGKVPGTLEASSMEVWYKLATSVRKIPHGTNG